MKFFIYFMRLKLVGLKFLIKEFKAQILNQIHNQFFTFKTMKVEASEEPKTKGKKTKTTKRKTSAVSFIILLIINCISVLIDTR